MYDDELKTVSPQAKITVILDADKAVWNHTAVLTVTSIGA